MLSNPTASFSNEIIFFWMKFKSNPKSLFLCEGKGRKCRTCSPPPKSISLAADEQNHSCLSWDSLLLARRCRWPEPCCVTLAVSLSCSPGQTWLAGQALECWSRSQGALTAPVVPYPPGATTVCGHLALPRCTGDVAVTGRAVPVTCNAVLGGFCCSSRWGPRCGKDETFLKNVIVSQMVFN